MFSNGENIKSSYFLGILAAFKRFPFSSIKPHLLESNFGRIDVPMGRVFRLIRGDTDLPLSGGPGTLRAMYYKKSGKKYKAIADKKVVVKIPILSPDLSKPKNTE